MYTRWVGNNVDLDLLATYLKKYLEEKGYKVEETHSGEKNIFLCKIPQISKGLEIVIQGKPEDFSVSTSFEAGRFPSLILYGLYSLFGGGFFILNEVKTEELMLALEKDLKFFLDRVVSLLTNSQKVRVNKK